MQYKTCSKCKKSLPATTEYFNRNKWHSDGLQRWCTECRHAYSKTPEQQAKRLAKAQTEEFKAKKREWDKRDRERHLEQRRAYDRQRNTTLERKEYNRQWNDENAEWRKEYHKLKYWENPEHFRAQKRFDHAKHKEHRNEHYRVRYHTDPAFHKAQREINLKAVARFVKTEYGKLAKKKWSSDRHARMLNAEGSFSADDVKHQIIAQTDKRGVLRCWWCEKAIKGDDYHVDHRIPLAKGGTNYPDNIVISHPKCNLSKGDKMPWEWSDRLL